MSERRCTSHLSPAKLRGRSNERSDVREGAVRAGNAASEINIARTFGPPPILLRSIDPSRNKLREGWLLYRY